MLRVFLRSTLLAAALLVVQSACDATTPQASAQNRLQNHYANHHATVCRPYEYGSPDLFYNFYVPSECSTVPVELYIAPRPVPAEVGHTYYTYQPFMPHEQLYKHSRVYHRYYNEGRGLSRTSIRWW